MRLFLFFILYVPLIIQAQDTGVSLELAQAFISEGNTKIEKVERIHKWVAQSISYDIEASESSETDTLSHQQRIKRTVDSSKGVCFDYSLMVDTLCKLNDITAYIVTGYVKNYEGIVNDGGHAWNVVEIDRAFYLLDATWDAGYINHNNEFVADYTTQYLFPDPSDFVQDHMPFCSMWQLLEHPVTHEYFNTFSVNPTDTLYFNYTDSIKSFIASSEIEQFQSKKRWLNESLGLQKRLDQEIEYIDNKIAHYSYSDALHAFNSGIDWLNEYQGWKRKHFKYPTRSDSEIGELFEHAKDSISYGFHYISDLKTTYPELIDHQSEFLIQQNNILSIVSREEEFLEKYLSKGAIGRYFMWFNTGF